MEFPAVLIAMDNILYGMGWCSGIYPVVPDCLEILFEMALISNP